MKKIHINTLGCKVNQYESASFFSSFEKLGHAVVPSNSDADVIIINTCTVTAKAGAQSRQAIRKAARNHPAARIIITGCHAQVAADELAALEELQQRSVCIIGNGDKHLLVAAALEENISGIRSIQALSADAAISRLPVDRFGDRTRAYLRIQDGCNSFCSYCIVPYTRGRNRSLPPAEVLQQAKTLALAGYKEIVVTGIHVGHYGADLEIATDIADIMEKLCHYTPDVRYRLSSIEPLEISTHLIDVMTENVNFMPHLHIPLQSGSDEILLRMNRRYSTAQFAEIVEVCRKRRGDLAIGLDILTGFPGESDNHFATTYSFLENLDFTYLHVFPYSRRPGTPAADFTDQVDKNIKDQRVSLLRQLGERKKEAFYGRSLNGVRSVLVENKRDKRGRLTGLTDNYIPVALDGPDSLKNSVVVVHLDSAGKSHVSGSIVQEQNER